MSDLVERLGAIASGLSNAPIGAQKRDVHDAASRITALEEENKRLRAALRPFAGRVFNDNGDLTVDTSSFTYDEIVAAYFALRRARSLKSLNKETSE